MNLDRIAAMGLAAGMACLAGCDPHPKPTPPKMHAMVDGTLPSSNATTLSPSDALRPADGLTTLVAQDEPRARGGGAFGVGIRPGRGASGISP